MVLLTFNPQFYLHPITLICQKDILKNTLTYIFENDNVIDKN